MKEENEIGYNGVEVKEEYGPLLREDYKPHHDASLVSPFIKPEPDNDTKDIISTLVPKVDLIPEFILPNNSEEAEGLCKISMGKHMSCENGNLKCTGEGGFIQQSSVETYYSNKTDVNANANRVVLTLVKGRNSEPNGDFIECKRDVCQTLKCNSNDLTNNNFLDQESLSNAEVNNLQKNIKKVLQAHVCRSHPSADSEIFECAHCSDTYYSKDYLKRHIFKKHMGKLHNINNKANILPTGLDSMTDLVAVETKKSRRNDFFYCKICNHAFNRRSKLMLHKKSKCGTMKLFPCHLCPQQFTTKESDLYHGNIDHGIVMANNYKCNICKKEFSTKATLRIHRKTFHQTNTNTFNSTETCSLYSNTYRTKTLLQAHIRRTHPHVIPDSFDYAHCSKMYNCKNNIRNIITRRHTGNEFEHSHKEKKFPISPNSVAASVKSETCKSKKMTYFYCNKCNHRFDRKCKLMLHEQSKCGSMKLFPCNICSKGFSAQWSVTSHLISVHGIGSAKFTCHVCNKEFSNRGNLRRHRKVFHQDCTVISLPQVCEFCKKIYNSRKLLQAHVERIHKKQCQYECAHCSQVFYDKYMLSVHMKKHHLNNQFKSPDCNKVFYSEIGYNKHREANICQDRHFLCEHCGKSLKTKLSLTNHLLTHTDEKAFMCQECGKMFKTESNLGQHSVTHSDVRPYTCDLCNKSFRIRNHLKQHMSVHGLFNSSQKYSRAKKNN